MGLTMVERFLELSKTCVRKEALIYIAALVKKSLLLQGETFAR